MYKTFSFATAVFGWTVYIGKSRVEEKKLDHLVVLDLVVGNYILKNGGSAQKIWVDKSLECLMLKFLFKLYKWT